MRKKEKIKIAVLVIIAVVLIFVTLCALVIAVYKYDSENRFVRLTEKIIPFPAIYIRGAGFVSVDEIKNSTAAVKRFYESQDFDKIGMRVDFSTAQGKKRLQLKEKEVLNKLAENKIIESLANKRGISISNAELDQEVDSNIEQYGNRQNLMSELSRLYGWSLEDFKKNVVLPELYTERLAENYSSGTDDSKQEEKINSLYKRIASKKEDFSKVASEASEGKSAENGGDLGWSTQDQLISPVADQAFSMKAGEVSDVIESPLGYHIIKIEDKKSEDGQNLVHIRQIFVKKTTFAEWLKEQMKNFQVVVFPRDYQWNTNEGQVEFTSPDLRSFEENTPANSQGDPSVFE